MKEPYKTIYQELVWYENRLFVAGGVRYINNGYEDIEIGILEDKDYAAADKLYLQYGVVKELE